MQKQSKAPLIILIFVLGLIGFFILIFSMMSSKPEVTPAQAIKAAAPQPAKIEQPVTIEPQQVEQSEVEDSLEAKQAAKKIYEDMLNDEHQAMRLLNTGSFTYFDNDWMDAFNQKLQTYWPQNIEGMSKYGVCDTAYRDLDIFLYAYENLLKDPLNPTLEKIEQQELADYKKNKAKCQALVQ